MLLKLFALILLSVFMAHHAHCASYSLLNMGPDFKMYIDQYRNSDADKQWFGWKAFEKKHQIYFDEAICNSSLKDCEKEKQKRLKDFFIQLPSFEKTMWEIFRNADVLSRDQLQNFRRMFPDTKQDMPIVFMPSLLHFNGRGGLKVKGVYTLIIGADLAALRNNNMSVLFPHELFHNYQFERLKDVQTYQTLASPIWFEGLAAWVSSQLAPKASMSDVLMNQDLAVFCSSKTNIQVLAKTFKPFLKMKYAEEKSIAIDSDWFSGSGETLPRRRGYCLGLHAISEIIKTHSITEILSFNESKFSDILGKALDKLSRF